MKHLLYKDTFNDRDIVYNVLRMNSFYSEYIWQNPEFFKEKKKIKIPRKTFIKKIHN